MVPRRARHLRHVKPPAASRVGRRDDERGRRDLRTLIGNARSGMRCRPGRVSCSCVRAVRRRASTICFSKGRLPDDALTRTNRPAWCWPRFCAAPLGAAGQIGEFSLISTARPGSASLATSTLKAGDTARQVIVIGGEAKIDCRVTTPSSIFGKAELGSTAVVENSIGRRRQHVDIAEGARSPRFRRRRRGAHAGPVPAGRRARSSSETAGFGEGLRASCHG